MFRRLREPGYAFNAALGHKDPEKLGAPATTVLLYDSINPNKGASDFVTSLPQPGRHEGKNNVAYADGHVKVVESP